MHHFVVIRVRPALCQLLRNLRQNKLKEGVVIWEMTDQICKTSSQENCLRKASGQSTEAP